MKCPFCGEGFLYIIEDYTASDIVEIDVKTGSLITHEEISRIHDRYVTGCCNTTIPEDQAYSLLKECQYNPCIIGDCDETETI